MSASLRGWLGLTAMVAGLGLVACQGKTSEERKEEAKDAARDVGKEVKQLGEKVEEKAGELTAKVSEDAKHGTIAAAKQTLEIKAALIADSVIDASKIDVDTDAATKTVVLKGTVPSREQKQAAERVARAKAEGYTIRNLLTVAPKAPKS